MTDQSSGGDLHPAGNAASGPAPVPPEFHRPANATPAENPRARGISPARDSREQAAATVGEATIRFGDGSEHREADLREALAERAQAQVHKTMLPNSPEAYAIKLPDNFRAPAGVQFEFDKSDPALAEFRKVAHARGLDQETFSDALGVYAALKIGEQTRFTEARAAELSKLGSAAQNRLNAVSTWLKARAGSDGDVLVNQLQKFPHAGIVKAYERIIQAFSHQGSADYQGGDRHHESQDPGKIAGYDGLSFIGRRVAQMQQAARGGGRGQE